MPALAGFNQTTLAETVHTEGILPLVLPAANKLRIYERIAWMHDFAALKAAKAVLPQWDSSPITGSKTEGDNFSYSDQTTGKKEITAAMVGRAALITDEIKIVGMMSPEAMAGKVVDELENRIDKDVLALFGGATNSSDFSGFNLGLDNWDAALALFAAQGLPGPRIIFVGSGNQIRDLRAAIRSSGGGSLAMGAGLDVINGLKVEGFVGTWQGVEIYQGNTTQADASNDSGGFLYGGIGDAVNTGAGLSVGFWTQTRVENDRRAVNTGDDLVVSRFFGVGITAENLVREFISKKAA